MTDDFHNLAFSENQSECAPVDPAVLKQLMPFNEYRFDDCMAHLSAKYCRPLSCYEMMKLHVMIDVYHTLDLGKPVIGGSFYPFTNGPVSYSSKGHFGAWAREYEKSGTMPDGFQLLEDLDRFRVKPTRVPEVDDFSDSEIAAMTRAWEDVVVRLDKDGFPASQQFFHDEEGFIGKAWKKARMRGTHLDWNEIIEAYDEKHPDEDHSRVKALLTL